MPQGDETSLDEILGHRFRDRELLEEGLTHPSASGGRGGRSYERLEFLGDRVLGIVLADLLFKAFPEEPEGDLAKRFAALAQRESLTLVAQEIGLAPLVRMAASEEQTGGRENPATLADAMEALIGALYLDGGLEACKAVVQRISEDMLTNPRHQAQSKHPKTRVIKSVFRTTNQIPVFILFLILNNFIKVFLSSSHYIQETAWKKFGIILCKGKKIRNKRLNIMAFLL